MTYYPSFRKPSCLANWTSKKHTGMWNWMTDQACWRQWSLRLVDTDGQDSHLDWKSPVISSREKLTEALGDIQGVFTIADDIIVTGCGDTISEAEHDNTEKLKLLYSRCKQAKIILNDDKKVIGLKEITFHWHKITSEGVKADDGKIKAIIDMPSPTDISGVKRFCGVVQYMAKFLPSLSTTLEPLRTLTRKDAPMAWTKKCEKAFTDVKKQLTGTPVLVYFNPDLELTLQTDSSKDGLGVVLLQNGSHLDFLPQRNENGLRLKRRHYLSYSDLKDLISILTAEKSSLKIITSP